MDDNLRVWRTFQMGNLLDLIILDTRNYDRSITSLGTFACTSELIHGQELNTVLPQAGMTIISA